SIADPISGKEPHWTEQRLPRSGSGHATVPHPSTNAELVHLCTVITRSSRPLSHTESTIRPHGGPGSTSLSVVCPAPGSRTPTAHSKTPATFKRPGPERAQLSPT